MEEQEQPEERGHGAHGVTAHNERHMGEYDAFDALTFAHMAR